LHLYCRTLTIAAIIGEAVGTTALIIPLSTAILISRTLTKMLAGHTVDEFQIHVKDLFFLEVRRAAIFVLLVLFSAPHDPCSASLPLLLCALVLQSDVPPEMSGGTVESNASGTSLIENNVPRLNLRMSPLSVAALLKQNELLGNVFNSFPVVSESGHLHGMVSRLVLAKALANKRGARRIATNVAELVMLAANQRREKDAKSNKGRVREVIGTVGNNFRSPPVRKKSRPPSLARSASESTEFSMHKYCRFSIYKSMDMGAIMDAAPVTFSQNTPIDRVYDAFSKMNLVVIGIVSSTTNQYQGVITRRKLLEFSGHAHHQHEQEQHEKSFWQKLKEGIFGDLDLAELGEGGDAPQPLPLQQRLIDYNRGLQTDNDDGQNESESDRESPSPTRRSNKQAESSNGSPGRRGSGVRTLSMTELAALPSDAAAVPVQPIADNEADDIAADMARRLST
jgi:CBS domain-containing protein